MPFGVSHRCFTIVMQRMCCQKVVIACGQFVLYLCRDGASQRCQWMPLCSVALSPHVLSLAKYLTMAFEKIHKIPIPQWVPPISFVLPQLCAHDAFKSHQTTLNQVCSFTHSASDHPCTPPPVVPTGRFRGPWPSLFTASTAAPAARSRSTAAVWPHLAAWWSGVQPQAPKGSETSTAGSTPWLSTAHPHTRLGEARICGVKSVNFIFFNIV